MPTAFIEKFKIEIPREIVQTNISVGSEMDKQQTSTNHMYQTFLPKKSDSALAVAKESATHSKETIAPKISDETTPLEQVETDVKKLKNSKFVPR